MSSKGTAEGRASERKRVHWRALILHADWRALPTQLVNISVTGACILSPDTRAVGAPMQIVLFVPDHRQNGHVMPWIINARVVYSVLGNTGFQLGLQFIQPDNAAVEYIRVAMQR